MDDLAKKFIDVYERAIALEDFDPGKARWRVDLSTWQDVMKSRFGAQYMVFGQPGDGNTLMKIPVKLISTRDIEGYRFTADILSTNIVQHDPTLICLGYDGEYGFSRYIVSAVSEAKFHQFDTTGFFSDIKEEA